MVEPARSIYSRSLFREAEFCVLVLEDMDTVNYFQSLIDDVVDKRNNPDITYTGAKDLRRQMLAYLEQYGEVQTANVWCRGLVVDLEHINELRQLVAERLANEGILGVVEIHLQDREINSPHIQFVGIEADRAEELIAELVVELEYERSIDTALGHGIYPYFQTNPNATTQLLNKELELEMRKKLIEEIEAEDRNFFDDMRKQREDFMSMLNSSTDEMRDELTQAKISSAYEEKPFYEKTNDEIVEELDTRIKNLRRRR